MIVVNDLVKTYGQRHAVDGVSFEVQEGQILGFLGPNGAGKTTTMRMITGFLPLTSGSISVAGYDVQEQSLQARRHIGYLPENVPLYLDMTVEGYLTYMAKLKQVPRSALKQRLTNVMEGVGLMERRREVIGRLSRGFRQRVGLAQALVHDPDVLILDEPTASLDPVQIRDVREYIRSLAGNHTIILSTHILPEVELVCDRVLVINQGRLVADDSPQNLRNRASGGTIVELDSRGNAHAIAEQLRRIAGVTAVAAPRGAGEVHQFRIEASRDVREDVARAVIAGGHGLLRLDLATRTLEDVFVELATADETARAAADGSQEAA